MQYFIDNITTYRPINQKWTELQAYVCQFEQRLIADELSLDALKFDIKHQVKFLNEKFPRTLPIRLESYSNGTHGQWSVYVAGNTDKAVCIIHYKKVMGYYKFSDKNEGIKKISEHDDKTSNLTQQGV